MHHVKPHTTVMKSREYAGCVFKTAPQPADLAILSLRCDFLFLSSMCPGGAGTAGTVAAGPDHTCHIEQKLQNIGGRSGKETCQEQLCASLQYRCDNIKDKQYCAERMQFHCVFHFRFHYQVLLSQDDQLRVFTLLSSFIYGFLLPYETSIKNKVSEKTDSRIQRSFVNCIFNCKYFSTTTLENWQLLLHSNKEKENDVNCGGADTRGQTQKDRPCMTVEGQTQGNRHMGTDTKGPSLYDMTPSLYDK